MSDFQLDTSGCVLAPVDPNRAGMDDTWKRFRWSDLTPFEQGYVKAMFASTANHEDGWSLERRGWGFSNLAPSALERIREDCAAAQSVIRHGYSDQLRGSVFWRFRSGELPWAGYGAEADRFPPLTPFLNDEGKIDLRESR